MSLTQTSYEKSLREAFATVSPQMEIDPYDYVDLGEDEMIDNVNNPDHYTYGNIECIDYLRDNMPYEAFLGFLEGNAKKYMHRWRHKGKPVEDIGKAIWYLDRLISELEGPEG